MSRYRAMWLPLIALVLLGPFSVVLPGFVSDAHAISNLSLVMEFEPHELQSEYRSYNIRDGRFVLNNRTKDDPSDELLLLVGVLAPIYFNERTTLRLDAGPALAMLVDAEQRERFVGRGTLLLRGSRSIAITPKTWLAIGCGMEIGLAVIQDDSGGESSSGATTPFYGASLNLGIGSKRVHWGPFVKVFRTSPSEVWTFYQSRLPNYPVVVRTRFHRQTLVGVQLTFG